MICIFFQHTGESMSNPQNRQVQQARSPVSSILSAFPHLLQVYGQLQAIRAHLPTMSSFCIYTGLWPLPPLVSRASLTTRETIQ